MSYKTFEDMKDQIPDGAVYYQNESEFFSFAWFNATKDKCHFNGAWYDCSMDLYPEEQIIKIPDQLDANLGIADSEEWKNGDECIYNGCLYVYQCVASWDSEACILSGKGVGSSSFTDAWINELSKPETPQQREERERLEAAKELYYESNKVMSNTDMVNHYNFDQSKDVWLAIVDKTGYRKEK